jgi:hypothetical protein
MRVSMKYNAAQTACETFHTESRRLHRKHGGQQ